MRGAPWCWASSHWQLILHRLTIGDLYLAGVASSIVTAVFDVRYEAYLPSFIARDKTPYAK